MEVKLEENYRRWGGNLLRKILRKKSKKTRIRLRKKSKIQVKNEEKTILTKKKLPRSRPRKKAIFKILLFFFYQFSSLKDVYNILIPFVWGWSGDYASHGWGQLMEGVSKYYNINTTNTTDRTKLMFIYVCAYSSLWSFKQL